LKHTFTNPSSYSLKIFFVSDVLGLRPVQLKTMSASYVFPCVTKM
jgi:hypothetical protein